MKQASGRGSRLIGKRLGIGVAAAVVDGHMDEVVPAFGPRPMTARTALMEAGVEALPTTSRDPAKLLHVQVHQLAGPVANLLFTRHALALYQSDHAEVAHLRLLADGPSAYRELMNATMDERWVESCSSAFAPRFTSVGPSSSTTYGTSALSR